MYFKHITLLLALLTATPLLSANQYHSPYEVIQLYTQDELNWLVHRNQHLQRVKKDDCQLVEDIEAHALKIKEPAYVFLWGDMLAWGVCVERDAPLGMYYIEQAAQQGLLAAIEQLGRYYERGILVQENKEKALIFYREAALQGFLRAQLSYVRMLNLGYGSPIDYEYAYKALFLAVIADKKQKQQAQALLKQLEHKMPEYIVRRAKRDNL